MRKKPGINGRMIIMLFAMAAFCGSACRTIASEVRNPSGTQVASARSAAPMRALYIPNGRSRNIAFMKDLIGRGKPLGVNMVVMDVHPYGSATPRIDASVVEYLKSENIYRVARVVCFQDGLDRMPVPEAQMRRLGNLVETAAKAGFQEVQLDYIRFKDGGVYYPLAKRYGFIEELLGNFKKITDANGVKLSADLFGRIVYNQNDPIGQKVEVFAKYADVIYPMLYPSHYTGDFVKMANPGETVREGTLRGMNRVRGTKVEIQPYIQAFDYMVGKARVRLDEYVRLQIDAVEKTGARGWVAWNAKGDYSSVFKALSAPANGIGDAAGR